MLWLALRFASLPLEVFARAVRPDAPQASIPLAIADVALNDIIACNEAARSRGVKPGMPLAAATALASDLHVKLRDVAAEQAVLERIAAWAIQFTPAVSIARPAEVLLEIEGSLTIFRGLKHLWSELAE